MSSPTNAITVLHLTHWGRAAEAALTQHTQAQVFAVFQRSAYLETNDGLCCIGSDTLGEGPLNAWCQSMPPLTVGQTVQLDQVHTQRWPIAPWPTFAHPYFSRTLHALQQAAQAHRPNDGFGAWIEDPIHWRVPQAMHMAQVACDALQQWLSQPNVALHSIHALLGLGPGLTPSGDDLIGGVLCALHAVGERQRANHLAQHVLPLAKTHTNRISRAHLACAAQGECRADLRSLLCALLQARTDFAALLAAVDQIGHTSGWDTLAGMVLVLHHYAQQRQEPVQQQQT